MSGDVDIKKRDGIVFLLLSCEFYPFMEGVEAFIEILSWVATCGIAAAQPWASWCGWRFDYAPAIVHIDEDMARDDA